MMNILLQPDIVIKPKRRLPCNQNLILDTNSQKAVGKTIVPKPVINASFAQATKDPCDHGSKQVVRLRSS